MAELIDPRQIAHLGLRRAFKRQAKPATLPHATSKAWRATVMAHPDWPDVRDQYGIDSRCAKKADWMALAWMLDLSKPTKPRQPSQSELDTLDAEADARNIIEVARKMQRPAMLVDFVENVLDPRTPVSDDYVRAYVRTVAQAAVFT